MQSDDMVKEAHKWLDTLRNQHVESRREYLLQHPEQPSFVGCCSFPSSTICTIGSYEHVGIKRIA